MPLTHNPFIFAKMRKAGIEQFFLFIIAVVILLHGNDCSFNGSKHFFSHRQHVSFKAKVRSQVGKPVVELKKQHIKVRYKPGEVRFCVLFTVPATHLFYRFFKPKFGEDASLLLANYYTVLSSRGPPAIGS